MLKYIKSLFTKKEVKEIKEERYDIGYFLANRHYLASIQPEDVEDTFADMSESEKKEYVAQASLIWSNPIFRQEMKLLFAKQALFISCECKNWEQSLIGRGTINGIGLVEDRFRVLHSIHMGYLENSKVDREDLEDLIIK